MDIVVNSRPARIALLSTVVVLVGIAALMLVPPLLVSEAPTAPAIPPDAMAAVDAVTAFYTMDYTEPPNLWPQRVCVYTTKMGCEAIRNFFAPSIQATVDKYRVQTYAFVEPIQMIADSEGRRLWKLEVTLTNPWDDETTKTQDVYAEVENQGSKWLLDRILFDQEIPQFVTPTP